MKWQQVGGWALVGTLFLLSTGATAGPGVPDPSWERLLPFITWPGAAVLFAWSPLGAAFGHWIRSRAGAGNSRSGDPSPETIVILQRIVESIERVVDTQDKQTQTLGKLHRLLDVLLDRIPRGANGVATPQQ